MTKTVEFFYDFGSPTVYLAATQLPGIADRLVQRLIGDRFTGGVFKSTGNQSPVVVSAKAAYMNDDLERFRNAMVCRSDLTTLPDQYLALMRGAVAYQDDAVFINYRDAVFAAIWVDACNLNEPEVFLGPVLTGLGWTLWT
ncbi:MAG: hypothetical protein CM1200mP41_39290 [Gammaproteobacteria bacterium]|nr:MAG: hypothetical protein CM1200mP41_39290 [Gammaproteobacteria bacterium]